MITVGQAMTRVLVAFVLSFLIGLDREKNKRPAGLKTHVIVALGSCLVTVVPFIYADTYGVDPTRIPAQVISGIGFLGAGTILRYGENVVGLTTAATLWVSGCIGVAAGLGEVSVCLLVTLLIFVVLKIVPYFERKFFAKKSDFQISMKMHNDKNELLFISDMMKNNDISIRAVHVDLDEHGHKLFKFNLTAKDKEAQQNFMEKFALLDNLHFKQEETELSPED